MIEAKTIQLHGSLAAAFGDTPIKVCAKTPIMITRFLTHKFGAKFKRMIAEGRFHLLKANEKDIGEEEVDMGFSSPELHFVPVVEGSSNVFRIILGVILIAASFIPGLQGAAPYLFSAGVGLALGGIVGLMTPIPKIGNQDYSNGLISNIFQGQQNVTTQGGPVPLVFGRFLTGSVVISAGIVSEEVAATTTSVPHVGSNVPISPIPL